MVWSFLVIYGPGQDQYIYNFKNFNSLTVSEKFWKNFKIFNKINTDFCLICAQSL